MLLKEAIKKKEQEQKQKEEESEKGLEQATKRIDSIKEQRQKELDKKEAEEKKRLEQQAKTDGLLKARGCEVEACAQAVEEAGSDAKSSTKAGVVRWDATWDHWGRALGPLHGIPWLSSTTSLRRARTSFW
eukprot:Skav215849  [mRNA]  locus=scaffold1630:172332:175051:- [translate_table: standard]